MKPIFFNTEMVKAILAGRKTVTRRLIKPQPPIVNETIYLRYVKDGIARFGRGIPGNSSALCDRKLPYQPGDVLYVRETWAKHSCFDMATSSYLCEGCESWKGKKNPYLDYVEHSQYGTDYGCYRYRADDERGEYLGEFKWKPSIHMPKEAARIFLRVTDVRVERLQDITVEQCIKEGFEGERCNCAWGCTDCQGSGWLEPPIVGFVDTWNSTIKKADIDKYGWDTNPWVFVIEFERISKEETLKNDD